MHLNLGTSRQFAGVDIHLNADGTKLFSFVLLERKGKLVQIVNSGNGLTDLSELKTLLGSVTPVCISLHGKGILHKKLEVNPDAKVDWLQMVLPNAPAEEFHVQLNPCSDQTTWVSVIRATLLEEWIGIFRLQLKQPLLKVFLGPFAITKLLTEFPPDSIHHAGDFSMKVNRGIIDAFEFQKEDFNGSYRHHNLDLPVRLFLAYASALAVENPDSEGITDSKELLLLQDQHRSEKKFQQRAVLLLVAGFVILLLNYVVFDHYWRESRQLQSKLGSQQQSLKELEQLKASYEQKKSFLDSNGLLDGGNTSFYMDQLAVDLPSEIRWNEVVVRPLQQTNTDDAAEKVSVDSKLIRIKGNCSLSSSLNTWMQHLKQLQWINQVKLISYTQTTSKEAGSFQLEISMR